MDVFRVGIKPCLKYNHQYGNPDCVATQTPETESLHRKR